MKSYFKEKTKKRSGTSYWIKRLWRTFAPYIRARDNYTCYTCGSTKNPQAGHYIPKSVSRLSLYFDERNVHCQCSHCNLYLKGNPRAYVIELERQYGHGILQEFDAKRFQIEKWTDEDFMEKENYFKCKMALLSQP